MDIQSLVQYKKSKRRERAARMAMAEETAALHGHHGNDTGSILDDLDSAEEDTDLLKLKPPRPPRPKKIKETLAEALYEEDIVEGFSFCSFKTFEDLDVSNTNKVVTRYLRVDDLIKGSLKRPCYLVNTNHFTRRPKQGVWEPKSRVTR